jgi:hypothetical protein
MKLPFGWGNQTFGKYGKRYRKANQGYQEKR